MRIGLFCISIFVHLIGFAQSETLPRFYTQEEDLVLEFSLKDYQGEQKTSFLEFFELENDVLLNNLDNEEEWNKLGWEMIRLEKGIIQCRKKLNSFEAGFSWQDKYKINAYLWKGPVSTPLENFDSIFINGVLQTNPDFKGIGKAQKVIFKLPGYENANEVILAGTFNDWNEEAIKLLKVGETWQIELNLSPGIYEYKFIIDGKWIHDRYNPFTVRNEYKTLNSILILGRSRQFTLNAFPNAKKVVISGSFNNWNEEAIQMEFKLDKWVAKVDLPPGKHFYKFLVDGKWILDPMNDLSQYDFKGNENSVLILRN